VGDAAHTAQEKLQQGYDATKAAVGNAADAAKEKYNEMAHSGEPTASEKWEESKLEARKAASDLTEAARLKYEGMTAPKESQRAGQR
jgi:hypothetical protein